MNKVFFHQIFIYEVHKNSHKLALGGLTKFNRPPKPCMNIVITIKASFINDCSERLPRYTITNCLIIILMHDSIDTNYF